MSEVGIVIIGRNEGERLRRCLASVAGSGRRVVYVDSGSTDGSVAAAESMGAAVVALDMSAPFTAARARNAGMERLIEAEPGVKYVQFVDGDCEVAAGWIERATALLEERGDVAIVCGRLRERFPETSVYNLLCDLDWDRPPGETTACGGIFMGRVAALREVGGFNPVLIAGEEPELCVRLRQRGGRVVRVADEMALHDAAMTRFGQFWRRASRTGWAFAANADLHGLRAGRSFVRSVARAVAWGGVLPLVFAASVVAAWWLPWLLLVAAGIVGLYLLQVVRIRRARLRGGSPARVAGVYALMCMATKPAEALGVLRFMREKLAGAHGPLIEYK